jgi:hypothetical protein
MSEGQGQGQGQGQGKCERVLLFGSRTLRDPEPIRAFVATLSTGSVVIHGGQRSWDKVKKEWYGADHFADVAAKARGLQVLEFPAEWRKYGLAAGPIRNGVMIREGQPTRAQGFRVPGVSKGTDDMSRQLAAAGIPHEVTRIGEAPRLVTPEDNVQYWLSDEAMQND